MFRAHRRIERDDCALRGIDQRRVALEHTVEHRLAVLSRRSGNSRSRGGFDEVAFAVDVEQAQDFAADLAADDEIGGRVDVVLREIRSVTRLHFAQHVAQQAGDVEHRCGVQRLSSITGARCSRMLMAFCVIEVARRKHHDHALAFADEGPHLGEARDLVDTGVGAGIEAKIIPRRGTSLRNKSSCVMLSKGAHSTQSGQTNRKGPGNCG
jgi:hypothetical protein